VLEGTHVDQVILLSQAGKTTHEDICASLELFGREVMPEFQRGHDAHLDWKARVLAGEIELEDHAPDADGGKAESAEHRQRIELAPE